MGSQSQGRKSQGFCFDTLKDKMADFHFSQRYGALFSLF